MCATMQEDLSLLFCAKRKERREVERLLESPLLCSGWKLGKWREVNGFTVSSQRPQSKAVQCDIQGAPVLVTGVLKPVCYTNAGDTKKLKSQVNVFVCLVSTL